MQTETLTPIAGALKYALSTNGYVYNTATGKRLKRRWTSSGYTTVIFSDDGRRVLLYHNRPVAASQRAVALPKDLRPIPNYQNYAVTPYGAIWRVSGERDFKPHMVAEHDRNGRGYVQLRNKFGKRHNKSVDKIVAEVWPES